MLVTIRATPGMLVTMGISVFMVSCTDSRPAIPLRNQNSQAVFTTEATQESSEPEAVDSNVESDSLVRAIQSENWKDYETELRHYLSDLQSPTEKSDRRFANVTQAIDRKIATSDGIGGQYFEWRTKSARLILASYTPKSTRLLARLTGNLALSEVFVRGEVTSPNSEHRLSDAKLILQAIKVASEFIEPDFDPGDPRNQPFAPVPVPGGNYLPGTAPESIADPAARESYLRAIAENHAKAARISAQLQAREDREKIRKAGLRFLRKPYSQPPAAYEELADLLTQLDVEPGVKTEIVSTASASVQKIEMKLKEYRKNEDMLKKLNAEGLID